MKLKLMELYEKSTKSGVKQWQKPDLTLRTQASPASAQRTEHWFVVTRRAGAGPFLTLRVIPGCSVT